MNIPEFQLYTEKHCPLIDELLSTDPAFCELHEKIKVGLKSCYEENQNRTAVPPFDGRIYNEFSEDLKRMCKDYITILEQKSTENGNPEQTRANSRLRPFSWMKK